mgnify:CR=1 FL=1
MQVKKDTLLSILDLAKIAVAGSEQVEQLSHFIFTGDEIITFNNRMSVVYPFKSNFVCSVKSTLFYKKLNKFSQVWQSFFERKSEVKFCVSGEKTAIQPTKKQNLSLSSPLR